MNVDPSEVMKSVKSLDLPDIKSLKAPVIPSGGISLPKFEGLPSVSVPKFEGLPSISAPKLPEIGMDLPNINLQKPDLKLPDGIKMPDVSSVAAAGGDRIKSFGDSAGKAFGNALESNGIELPKYPFAEKEPEITTYGRGPYKVPMPYLDRKIIEAEKERKAQETLAAEQQEAARIQQIREETEAQLMARQNMEREQALQERTQFEARMKQEADDRVRNAEEEAARLRAEVEQTRLAAIAKEKAAAEETARFAKEAETAFMKEQAAKEEFTRKLQEAELAKLQEAQDFQAKLADAEQAAAKGRVLEEEAIAKQRMVEEAASRQAVASAEVRRASIGAAAARKAAYPSPSLSTYQAWQERQRAAYETQMASVVEVKSDGALIQSPSSPTGDKLSTYQRWQKNIVAKQIVSASTDPVKAAYITGAPAPVINQVVSGTTQLSEAATALNGDLGYVIAGSVALVAGITYAYENQKIQDELLQIQTMQPFAGKTVAPPPPPSVNVQPIPPVVPPASVVQVKQEVVTSVTMAIDAKKIESTSVTKAVSPPSSPPLASTTSGVEIESVNETPTAPETFDVNMNQRSYLESMSNNSDGVTQLKSSYSPFSNVKKAPTNDSLYNPPSIEMPQAEEEFQDVFTPDDSDVLDTTDGRSYLESMSTSGGSTKASYSPFSNAKKAITNDSLYNAPSSGVPQVEEEYPEVPVVEDSGVMDTATNGQSYLESMSVSEGSPKASYSPFGTPKIISNDSLYAPPEDGTSDEQQAEVNGGSYFDSLSGLNGDLQSYPKASYSPFGTPKVVTNNSLYGPPDMPIVSEAAEASTPPVNEDFADTLPPSFSETTMSSNQGSYLSALNDSSESILKTSYSPFGRKPQAVDDSGFYSPGNSY